MRRQAGGQQRRSGQQATTTGDGVDETGNESDKGQNGQGSEVNAEFERHGMGLFGGAQEEGCEEDRYLTHKFILLQPIVPTLCVGMHPVTLCVTSEADAERPWRHSHAERGNDHYRVAGPLPICHTNGGSVPLITQSPTVRAL